jgi:hypothetical protein
MMYRAPYSRPEEEEEGKSDSIKERSSIEPNKHSATEEIPSNIYDTERLSSLFTKASKYSQS